ncbi:Coiled-coil domain-containing protein 43 [Portunus trituberculatus]|uniref:Coiled-coil domain-containing protein 43 n=1 Tax=Portunus trituberculatus TaxID=210409 RepID=A0A5B7CT70_PORTR|nr:Coiled-coil domain-containing protein 43 [Portunus trituberculatus]
MAEAAACDFDEWLRDTLVALDTDDEVFSPYIKGILEGEENADEKLDALQGILSEITVSVEVTGVDLWSCSSEHWVWENGIDDLCQDILRKWNVRESNGPAKESNPQVSADECLARIMGEQAQMVVTTRVRTQEEQNLKSAILAQYAQVSDGEVTDSDGEEEVVGLRNTNAEEVVRAEREKREKDKEESQRKKEKDKEDRLKQKSKDDERKEKEKKRTQKGERRR